MRPRQPSTTGLRTRTISVTGAVLTLKQLHAEIERATGRTLELHQLGTIADLEVEIEKRKATARNPYEYVSLQYQWAMVTGKGKPHNLSNDDYPDITPVSVAQMPLRLTLILTWPSVTVGSGTSSISTLLFP